MTIQELFFHALMEATNMTSNKSDSDNLIFAAWDIHADGKDLNSIFEIIGNYTGKFSAKRQEVIAASEAA